MPRLLVQCLLFLAGCGCVGLRLSGEGRSPEGMAVMAEAIHEARCPSSDGVYAACISFALA